MSNVVRIIITMLVGIVSSISAHQSSHASEKCGCNSVSMVFVQSAHVYSMQHLIIGSSGREFKVYQGGSAPYTIHNCICSENISCQYMATGTSNANDHDTIGVVDSGCMFKMGPGQTVPLESDCVLVGHHGC